MTKKKSNKSETKENQKNETRVTEEPENEKEETPAEANGELEKLKTEYETQKDQFMRLAAEYDNFRKRTEKEKLATYDNAVAATVEAFLPVVDNFALALSANTEIPDDFKKGLEMISRQLDNAFEKLNVVSFGERGEEFDPELHNAIAKTSDDELEEDHITQVYQKGYKIGDKIIRHAMVQISE